MKQHTKLKVSIAVFLTVVLGLSAANLIIPTKEFSEDENRPLAQNPEFSLKELFSGDYTKKFESFTTDQFPARSAWVSLKVGSDMLVQKKDSNDVYFADDNYLIEKFTQHTMNSEQLNTNTLRLSDFSNKQSASLGSDHVRTMIVPTAGYILQDLLPAYAPTLDQAKVLSDMEKSFTDGNFINTTDTLLANKSRQLYYKTDHHWTTYAAFLAYTEWGKSIGLDTLSEDDFQIETVSEDFLGTIYSKANHPGIKSDKIEIYKPKQNFTYSLDFNFGEKQSDSLYNMDFLNKKDKYAMFLNGNNSSTVIKTNVKNGKKLLIVKDSYAHCFVPFAANHFEQLDVLDLRYYHQSLSSYVVDNGITDVLVLYNLNTFSSDTNTGAFTAP